MPLTLTAGGFYFGEIADPCELPEGFTFSKDKDSFLMAKDSEGQLYYVKDTKSGHILHPQRIADEEDIKRVPTFKKGDAYIDKTITIACPDFITVS